MFSCKSLPSNSFFTHTQVTRLKNVLITTDIGQNILTNGQTDSYLKL